MKMVCVNTDDFSDDLTYHKAYDVEEVERWRELYSIISDSGIEKYFAKCRFIPLSEYRENKLNQLLEKLIPTEKQP